MTEDRLDHIERLFRSPPSAAAMADIGLELVAELRKLRLTPLEHALANAVTPERERVGDVMQPIGEVEMFALKRREPALIADDGLVIVPEAKPTPDIRPFKRKAK